jgi:DNA repair protein RadC
MEVNMKRYRVELVCESGADEPEEVTLRTSTDAANALRSVFEGADREKFVAMMLDAKHRAIAINLVSIGSLTASIVHAREVFRPVLLLPTAAIILAHNHPSGDATPSSEDVELTRRLRQAGEIFGIPVLDHVILGDGQHYSFADSGAW